MAGINKTACCQEHSTCDGWICPDGTAPVAPTPYCGGVDPSTCNDAICCQANCVPFAGTPRVQEYSLTISPNSLDLSQLPPTTLASISDAVWAAAKSGPGCAPIGFQFGAMRIERTDAGTMLMLEVLMEPDNFDLLNEMQKHGAGLELGRIVGREVRRHASSYATVPASGNCTVSSDMAFGRPVTTSASTPAPQLVNSADVSDSECLVIEGDNGGSVAVDLGAVVPVRTVHVRVPSSVCAPGAACTTTPMSVSVQGGTIPYNCVQSSAAATTVFLCPAPAAGSSLVVRAANSLKLCKIQAFLTSCF